MGIRNDPTDMIAITTVWIEGELIRKGTVLPSSHPAVKRNAISSCRPRSGRRSTRGDARSRAEALGSDDERRVN
jgi:hypothetical protein